MMQAGDRKSRSAAKVGESGRRTRSKGMGNSQQQRQENAGGEDVQGHEGGGERLEKNKGKMGKMAGSGAGKEVVEEGEEEVAESPASRSSSASGRRRRRREQVAKKTVEKTCEHLVKVTVWSAGRIEMKELPSKVLGRRQRYLKYKCDVCEVYPIKRFRWECLVCDDFDMCDDCVTKGNCPHDSSHDLIRFTILSATTPRPLVTMRTQLAKELAKIVDMSLVSTYAEQAEGLSVQRNFRKIDKASTMTLFSIAQKEYTNRKKPSGPLPHALRKVFMWNSIVVADLEEMILSSAVESTTDIPFDCATLNAVLVGLVEQLKFVDKSLYGWFTDPVKNVPGYDSVIKVPSELSSIAKWLETEKVVQTDKDLLFKHFETFCEKLELIWTNAMSFNPETNAVHIAAEKLNIMSATCVGTICRIWPEMSTKFLTVETFPWRSINMADIHILSNLHGAVKAPPESMPPSGPSPSARKAKLKAQKLIMADEDSANVEARSSTTGTINFSAQAIGSQDSESPTDASKSEVKNLSTNSSIAATINGEGSFGAVSQKGNAPKSKTHTVSARGEASETLNELATDHDAIDETSAPVSINPDAPKSTSVAVEMGVEKATNKNSLSNLDKGKSTIINHVPNENENTTGGETDVLRAGEASLLGVRETSGNDNEKSKRRFSNISTTDDISPTNLRKRRRVPRGGAMRSNATGNNGSDNDERLALENREAEIVTPPKDTPANVSAISSQSKSNTNVETKSPKPKNIDSSDRSSSRSTRSKVTGKPSTDANRSAPNEQSVKYLARAAEGSSTSKPPPRTLDRPSQEAQGGQLEEELTLLIGDTRNHISALHQKLTMAESMLCSLFQ